MHYEPMNTLFLQKQLNPRLWGGVHSTAATGTARSEIHNRNPVLSLRHSSCGQGWTLPSSLYHLGESLDFLIHQRCVVREIDTFQRPISQHQFTVTLDNALDAGSSFLELHEPRFLSLLVGLLDLLVLLTHGFHIALTQSIILGAGIGSIE